MLNRTNRTLSAQNHRLNLGTRSLALVASVINNDSQTLHTRHAFAAAMRAGVSGVVVSPHIMARYAPRLIPGSPSVSPWLFESCEIDPVAGFFHDAPSDVDRRVDAFDPTDRLEAEPGLLTRTAVREPLAGKRRQQASKPAGSWMKATPGPVAANHAAAGG